MIEKLKAYPKAWELFDNSMPVDPLTLDDIYLIGPLYRFLDDGGIHVNVFLLATYSTYPEYGYDILVYNNGKRESNYYEKRNFHTRPEAEDAAFIKAFEILEERIK